MVISIKASSAYQTGVLILGIVASLSNIRIIVPYLFYSNNKKVKPLVYPFKQGRKWVVYHSGQVHEFKTLGMADDFARTVNSDILRALRSKD